MTSFHDTARDSLLCRHILPGRKAKLRGCVFIIAGTMLSVSVAGFGQQDDADSVRAERLLKLRADLKRTPEAVEFRLEIVTLLLEAKQNHAALAHLDTALNRDRRNAEAWLLKANAHRRLGASQVALKCLDRAERLRAGDPAFMLERGKVHFGNHAFDEANEAFLTARARAELKNDVGALADALFWLGQVSERQDDASAALRHYRAGLRAAPGHLDMLSRVKDLVADSLLTAADVDFRSGRFNRARTALHAVLLSQPGHEKARSLLAEIDERLVTPSPESAKDPAGTGSLDNSPERTNADSTRFTGRPGTEGLESISDSSAILPSRAAVGQPAEKAGTPKIRIPGLSLSLAAGLAAGLLLLAGLITWVNSKRAPRKATSAGHARVTEDILASLSRYEMEGEIGKGSMGRVYKGRDLQLDRQVAVKVVRFDNALDRDEWHDRIVRFQREAKATARLNHNNIVKLYDYSEVDGTFYMTMELVDGKSLREILADGHLPVGHALDILRQALNALDYAHSQQVVHRDLKPSNIMVTNDGEVKVLDFGLAKLVNLAQQEAFTQTGNPVGTPFYMSPEQINSDAVDGRSDLYSLGVVFYEMLTGRLPFEMSEGDGVARFFYKALHDSLTLPGMIVKNIPPDLDATVNKMLARRPEDRFASAGEVLRNLGPYPVSP